MSTMSTGTNPEGKVLSDRHVHITFAHVSGFGKVKQELQEVVTFLQAAQEGSQVEHEAMKLALFGQREHSRTVLVGAVAGEAKVPLFYLTGTTLSDQPGRYTRLYRR